MFDYLLLLAIFILIGMGVMFIYSSSINSEGISVTNEYIKQIIWAVAGLIILIITTLYDYRRFEKVALYFYGIFILVLLIVLIPHVGRKVNGARSWLGIGAHVWKNQPNAGTQQQTQHATSQQPKPKRRFTDASIDNAQFCEQYCEWLYKAYMKNPQGFDVVKLTEQFYDVDELVKPRISAVFANYVAEKKELAQQQYQ